MIIVQVAEPDKIILFGSHAREDDSLESDYDLLVLKRGVKKDFLQIHQKRRKK